MPRRTIITGGAAQRDPAALRPNACEIRTGHHPQPTDSARNLSKLGHLTVPIRL
jgi:hypothetical protein